MDPVATTSKVTMHASRLRHYSGSRAAAATASGGPFGLGPAPDEHRLLELFIVRPDLATPEPESMDELAWKMNSYASLQSCMDRLDRFSCQVAQVLAIVSAAPTRDEVRQLLGSEDVTSFELDQTLEALRARGLLELDGDSLRVHPELRELRTPAGLGPIAEEVLAQRSVDEIRSLAANLGVGLKVTGLSKQKLVEKVAHAIVDPERVLAVIHDAPDDAFALAMRLASGPPGISTSGGFWSTYSQGAAEHNWRAPHLWLARKGLVIELEWYSAVMPRQIALTLRGGRPFATVSAARPEIRVVDVEPENVDRVAAARGIEAVEAVERLIDCLGANPASLLKSTGIGARELRRLAQACELDIAETAFMVEVARHAGLVGPDHRTWTAAPLPASDTWLDLELEERWAALVSGWLDAPAFLSLAGASDSKGKPQPALFDWGDLPVACEQRRLCLSKFAEVAPGSGLDERSLFDRIEWDSPLIWSQGPSIQAIHFSWVLGEAEVLGVLAQGSLSEAGRAALSGDPARAADLFASHLPPATRTVVLQADLTAIAAGRLPTRVRSELDLIADVESTGAARVYRFSEVSIRRGLDAGRTATDLSVFLESVAAKGVPQPLQYLVTDVGRRHGQIRAGAASSYVRFEDPALATEALRAKRTTKLHFRQLAPTVLVSDTKTEVVLETLREAGFLPSYEAPDGTVVTEERSRHRVSPDVFRMSHAHFALPRPEKSDLQALVRRLLLLG